MPTDKAGSVVSDPPPEPPVGELSHAGADFPLTATKLHSCDIPRGCVSGVVGYGKMGMKVC